MSETKTFTREHVENMLKETQNFTKLNYSDVLLRSFTAADPLMIKDGASEEYKDGWRAAMNLVRHTIETMVKNTPRPDGADDILRS